MAKRSNGKPAEPAVPPSISRITVSGFKSIGEEQSIDIAPLTILAGANSSGKSSIMQPLLLLKQTLECSYDPGALLLDGPNVKFTSSEQLITLRVQANKETFFSVGVGTTAGGSIRTTFEKRPGKAIDVQLTEYDTNEGSLRINRNKSSNNYSFKSDIQWVNRGVERLEKDKKTLAVRSRCFLKPAYLQNEYVQPFEFEGVTQFDAIIKTSIHLPGHRGNPQRNYPVSADDLTFSSLIASDFEIGRSYSGTFEPYSASVIAGWQSAPKDSKLEQLTEDLVALGLTWKVSAKRINEAHVELQVGRLPKRSRSGTRDMVNIADVGFGVSQVLPVLVALRVAKPGQLVYIEEPELHLHPRAQSAMAEVIADAASRGVRVVIETHSSLLILGIQTLVAEGKLNQSLVKLHWFQRDKEGMTKVTSRDLNEDGTFGDWPEDFADVTLNAQDRFLTAVESRMGL